MALAAAAIGLAKPPCCEAASPQSAARVWLTTSPQDDALLVEVAKRMAAELRAAGFEAATEQSMGEDVAEINLSRASDVGDDIAVQVTDRLSDKRLLRRIELAPQMTPALIATRAAELLWASFLEIVVARDGQTPKPVVPQAVRTWVDLPQPPRAETHLSRASMGAAFGLLFGLSGASTSGMGAVPHLNLDLPLGRKFGGDWALEAHLAGPSFWQNVKAVEGEARVRQALGWVSLACARALGPNYAYALSAGLGGHWLRSEGEGSAPAVGQVSSRGGGIAVLGASFARRLSRLAFVVADVHGVAWLPPVAVRIAGRQSARTPQPAFVTTVGVRVSW